jgi:hypothetical protein
MSTRPSNATKHPGIPDQKKKKWSPAEMAALRAAEKSAQEQNDTAKLAARMTIAGVEDSMAITDQDDEENATRPVPVDIPRAPRSIQ